MPRNHCTGWGGPRRSWLMLTLPTSPPHTHSPFLLCPSCLVLVWLGCRRFSQRGTRFHSAEPLHRLVPLPGLPCFLFCLVNYACLKIPFKQVKRWWPAQVTSGRQGGKLVMASRGAGWGARQHPQAGKPGLGGWEGRGWAHQPGKGELRRIRGH